MNTLMSATVALVLLAFNTPAISARIIGWEYQATITHVTDGDTMTVALPPSPFRNLEKVRLYGINSPESTLVRAKCKKEAKLGQSAKVWAREHLPVGSKVTVRIHAKRLPALTINDKIDERYGRLIADIVMPDGKDFADEMIKAGNATRYYGFGPKTDWCQ